MAKIAKFIRRWTRFIAGAAFWVHAFLIFGLPLSFLQTAASRVGLTVAEMLLAVFFLAMAILNGYGFWKFVLDLIYIYVFPFIFMYKVGALAFSMLSRIPGYAAQFLPGIRPKITWKDMFRELSADEAAFSAVATQVASPMNSDQNPTATVSSSRSNLWVRFSLPLRSFTIAWCVLIVVTNKPVFALLGVIVLTAHLIRFIFNLAASLAKAGQFLRDVERKAMDYAMNLLNTVMNAPEDRLTNQDVVRAVHLLGWLRGSAFLMINRVEVSYLFFLTICLVYIGFYVRLAVLFGFLYLGIAKLNHLPLTFVASMVNSFAMPFSYTDYPNYWLMRLAELIHTLVWISLSAGAVMTYVRQKLQAFQNVAELVWKTLDQADVRSRMSYAAQKAKPKTPEPKVT